MAKATRIRGRPKAATTARHAPRNVSNIRQIPLDAIDWSFTVRSINADHVERLAGAAQLPPIKVWEFQPGQYRGIDGYHRWRLATGRGQKRGSVIVRCFPKGREGEKAFDFECVQSNLQHGLPLTREERDRAIVRIWNRWGRHSARSDGETLDDLGKLFNLTKQRIHQILFVKQPAAPEGLPAVERKVVFREETFASRGARPRMAGAFSSFGRFSAATRRLSRLLGDSAFISDLLRTRQPDVLKELHHLRSLIDDLVQSEGRSDQCSPALHKTGFSVASRKNGLAR